MAASKPATSTPVRLHLNLLPLCPLLRVAVFVLPSVAYSMSSPLQCRRLLIASPFDTGTRLSVPAATPLLQRLPLAAATAVAYKHGAGHHRLPSLAPNFPPVDGKLVRRERDHHRVIAYDDINQLFWYPEGIARIVLMDKTRVVDIPPAQRFMLFDHINWNPSQGHSSAFNVNLVTWSNTSHLACRLLFLFVTLAPTSGPTVYIAIAENQSGGGGSLPLILGIARFFISISTTLLFGIMPSGRMFDDRVASKYLASQTFTALIPNFVVDEHGNTVMMDFGKMAKLGRSGTLHRHAPAAFSQT
ncbi:hypothetical protein BGW80DRAFT_1561716 [Lactifluus volemus]|nr:hypothetical protein BGW80DRAFT_1561716 [Lactifluus volemus]